MLKIMSMIMLFPLCADWVRSTESELVNRHAVTERRIRGQPVVPDAAPNAKWVKVAEVDLADGKAMRAASQALRDRGVPHWIGGSRAQTIIVPSRMEEIAKMALRAIPDSSDSIFVYDNGDDP